MNGGNDQGREERNMGKMEKKREEYEVHCEQKAIKVAEYYEEMSKVVI